MIGGKGVKTTKLTLTALFLSLSFMLSLLEGFVPISVFVPIPGLKLGFANIAVMAAILYCGRISALCIVVLRPLLNLLLFGNITSFILSLSGGLLSYFVLLFTVKLYKKAFTFGGISVISAVCHSIGQIIAASIVVTSGAVYSYLPLLCAASAVTGMLTGVVMNLVYSRLDRKNSGDLKI